MCKLFEQTLEEQEQNLKVDISYEEYQAKIRQDTQDYYDYEEYLRSKQFVNEESFIPNFNSTQFVLEPTFKEQHLTTF